MKDGISPAYTPDIYSPLHQMSGLLCEMSTGLPLLVILIVLADIITRNST
jgi:hypothetical protein